MIVIFRFTCYLKLTGDMLEWHNLGLVLREPCDLIFRYILYRKKLGGPSSRFGMMDDHAAKAFRSFSIKYAKVSHLALLLLNDEACCWRLT